MLDPDDSIILLIDHQSGLFNTVRDVPVPDLRNYVIAIAKAAADPRSYLAHSTTTEADPDAAGGGVIVASNDEFVAVQQSQGLKRYRTAELAKNVTYDGIGTDGGRFAPGNKIERKNGKDGMRTLLIEEREHMQSEAKREQERYNDLGR